VTLAYAVTAHGSQGLTVDTSHSLIDPATSRAGVYVPGTCGRDTSTFYVVCSHTADEHSPQGMDRSPRAVLTDILTRPDQASLAAELARREGLDEGRSLAWVGVPWDLLTTEYTRDRATDTLLELLGADTVDRVTAEAGYPRLIATVRAMELAGHDPAAVLTEAVRQASLHDAASVSDVLRYRIRRLDHTGRIPEREVRDGDWTTYTTPLAGPVGDYAHRLAKVATARQTELGQRAAADPPGWAVAAPTLGPPPVRVLHRRIPEFVGQVRHQLRSSPGTPRRNIVLDLSAVPPMPTAAPLLFLVHLLRRLVNERGEIDVIGVTPALRAALTAFDLPGNMTVIDVHGRRWPS
jgi:hypothetical protein